MKWLEKLLLPFAIVLVGTIGSIIISRSQIESAILIGASQIESSEKIADAQIQCQDKNVKSEQEIKVLDIFFSKITHDNPKNRQYAIKLMDSISPELAQRLYEAVINDESQNEIHGVALIRLKQMNEIKEEQHYQSLSDSSRKEDVDYLKEVADTQFKAKYFKEALDNYYEILNIFPEDEYANKKINEIKEIQEKIKIKSNLKKTKPKKD